MYLFHKFILLILKLKFFSHMMFDVFSTYFINYISIFMYIFLNLYYIYKYVPY